MMTEELHKLDSFRWQHTTDDGTNWNYCLVCYAMIKKNADVITDKTLSVLPDIEHKGRGEESFRGEMSSNSASFAFDEIPQVLEALEASAREMDEWHLGSAFNKRAEFSSCGKGFAISIEQERGRNLHAYVMFGSICNIISSKELRSVRDFLEDILQQIQGL